MKSVDLDRICEEYGIRTYSYQHNPEVVRALGLEEASRRSGGGLALYYRDMPIILFDENLPDIQLRFIVAHEIGHIMLGHVSFRAKLGCEQVEASEKEADAFAVQLLANDLARQYVLNDSTARNLKEAVQA